MTKPIRGFTAAHAAIAGIVATALCLMLSSPLSSRGDQVPSGCAGNGSGGNIGVLNGATHHVGDAVNFTVGIQVPAGQCQASNVTARLTFPDGTHLDYASPARTQQTRGALQGLTRTLSDSRTSGSKPAKRTCQTCFVARPPQPTRCTLWRRPRVLITPARMAWTLVSLIAVTSRSPC